MKYRKKPVVIDAFKWTGDQTQTEDPEWIIEAMKKGDVQITTGEEGCKMHIKTIDGTMTADLGCYIIRGIHGEIYPCKPEIFEATYSEEKEVVVKGLIATVFPSTECTVVVEPDQDYGGAHKYHFTDSTGFKDGKANYVESKQSIQFVQKNEDGSMTPGVQSEQLLIALIDRHKKLNAKFPSREGALAITKMEESLMWLEARVKERIARDVMGELKK